MLTTQNTAVRGYAFSTAVDTTWGIIETGPFFVRGRTVDSEGDGRPVFTHKKGGGSLLHFEHPFHFAKFMTVLHLSKKGGCRLI